ncbi:MAG: SpoIVB peptidase [Clostridia bacterium]|nr:SpoIVB peptidase [Clostridia bacterium]
MKKLVKIFAVLMSVLSISALSTGLIYSESLPDYYQVNKGDDLNIQSKLSISAKSIDKVDAVSDKQDGLSADDYEAELKLFGLIPIKTVQVDVIDEMYVVPSGKTFGIKIFTQGVMVVGMTDVDSDSGLVNPAKKAGIKIGDVIVTMNGTQVNSNETVAKVIEKSGGKEIDVVLMRRGKKCSVKLRPIKSAMENKYKAGLWVRDSSAGIGTLTFYNPTTGAFGGLGHAICDVDTGLLLPLESGEIVDAKINSINKGTSGKAGELCGVFTGERLGDLLSNCDMGVYGVMDKPMASKNIMKVALKQEVKTGKAKILTSIDNNGPKYYDCLIEKVKYSSNEAAQNMVIRVMDKELISKTGGIVQGMSGSPVIQNGKLIGAVTHVFVNDPTKGYAIFAETMLEMAQGVAESSKLKDAS